MTTPQKAPKYIPVWFRERCEELAYQNQFGYAGVTIKSRNAFHRFCWTHYWNGKVSIWRENAKFKNDIVKNTQELNADT